MTSDRNGADAARPDAAADAAQERLSAILDHAADAIVVSDERGVIETVNLAAGRLFGWEPSELVGRRLEVLTAPAEQDAHQGYIDRYLRTGVSGILNVGPRALVGRRRDGRPINIELSVGVAFVGGERKFIGACRDIAQRIAAEAELADTVAALNQTVAELKASTIALEAARAAAEAANLAKSRFLATMSHEIRTPLNGVLSVADVLAERIKAPADHDLVEIIRQSGRTLLTLLNEVLDLSKIEAGAFTLAEAPFSLRALLESSIATWRTAAEAKGLALRLEACDPPALIGDEDRLRQVISNLLGNAVKFTDAGGVTVACRCQPLDAGRSQVEISVTDTGPGFDAGFASRLFQPFVQADSTNTRRHGGTGLGLAICRELVELMGGRISAERVEPHGARFTIQLALKPARAIARAPEADRTQAFEAGYRVLVAEDHPLNRLVMGVLLDELGVDYAMAENGEAAVAAVAQGDFDAVLMDVQMPVMDGLEATRAIRQLSGRRGRVPIIAVTADVMSGHVQACKAAGMNDFLAKPVQPRALQQALLEHLPAGGGGARRIA